MMACTLKIAGVSICLNTEQPIRVTEAFRPFCWEGEADYQVFFRQVSELPEFPEHLLYRDGCFSVAFDGRYCRRFADSRNPGTFYAVAVYDWEQRQITVSYIPGGSRYLTETGNCFFHIAWETVLLREYRLILHSCCMETNLGGVLFSGPSGIGKSTQGRLWRIHRNAGEINGDRAVLLREEKGWRAYGSPYAGSSNCYVNASVDVGAVVMLRQSEENRIRRLKTAEAFCRIFTQLTVPTWDHVCTASACELTEKLVREVPVYEMSCTPDLRAVELLEETLRKEEGL